VLRRTPGRLGGAPLRRIGVPRDLAAITTTGVEADPHEAGMTPAAVERIWRGVEALFRSGVHPAIGLCVRRNGVVVLDRALGWERGADPAEDRAPEVARPGTPYCVYSASKAVTATVVHLLVDRGTLHLDDHVADYVPQFAAPQLDQITIDHVLSHRAGIPLIPRDLVDLDRLADTDVLLDAIPKLKVAHAAGAALSYHAVSGGFVLAEVVKQATGKDIRDVLTAEILRPLGFRWTSYGVAADDVEAVGRNYPTGPPVLPPLSLMLSRTLGMPVDDVTRAGNDPRFLAAVVPAANVVTTANELSRFYEILRRGGTLDGVQVLRPETIRAALVERSYHEIDRSLGAPLRHASGYMLGARLLGLFGPDSDDAFGHLGFTNVMGWADPRREITVGLITSGKPVLAPHLPSLWNVTRLIGAAAPKVRAPLLYTA
jgi:CubicO group peptidase (beta-lactamase class C family)